jgi:hypothetical protein
MDDDQAPPAAAPAPGSPGPAAVLKEETARQAVILVAGVLMIVTAAWAERYFTSPDAHALLAARVRRARPRAWKAAERASATVAAQAWKAAEAARLQHAKAAA